MAYLAHSFKAALAAAIVIAPGFVSPVSALAGSTGTSVIDGLDYGPLAQLVGS